MRGWPTAGGHSLQVEVATSEDVLAATARAGDTTVEVERIKLDDEDMERAAQLLAPGQSCRRTECSKAA